jgi:phage gpG-like protein
MGFRLTGDFRGLQRKIDQLAHPEAALARTAEAMADEALNLINEGFQGETDPYGKPWAPLVLRSGKILQDRGGMAASWHRSRANKFGFRVRSGKTYASFHQDGTGIYGPKKQPIRPVSGKALAFKFQSATLAFGKRGKRLKRSKAIMSQVVVRSVKGAPARKMVPDAGKPLPLHWKQRLVRKGKTALKVHFGV